MEYFYFFAFILILINLITTIAGLTEPNRATLCGFQLGMLLVIAIELIAAIQ